MSPLGRRAGREGAIESLVSVPEIADMLGVSGQRVHQLAATKAFPSPASDLAARRVWKRSDVEKWAKATGRTIVGER